jgi:ABC-2 type transport system ATP-binding protein
MSELENTADDLIVIGRGRLIAETTVADLLVSASNDRVDVRTPTPTEVMTLLGSAGATVTSTGHDTLTISGLSAEAIADLTAEQGLRLYGLSSHRASLEDAYMDLTREAVEFAVTADGQA